MTYPSLNQLRGAIAVQFLLACAAIYEGYVLHGWRQAWPGMFEQLPDAYASFKFTQHAWLGLNAISMGLALVFAVIAMRRRSEIDGGTTQVKLHWTLLFVPPVCTMLVDVLIWI